MAFYFQKTYRPEIEQLLRQYYQSLSEKDRRRFAALEAIKLGMVAPATLPRFWDAILKPSQMACGSSSNCPMIQREVVSESPEADAKRRKSNKRT